MEHLLEKIKKIEALIAGTTNEGEKQAAILAKERILKKNPGLSAKKDAIEYKLTTADYWQKRLLIAVCRKYGLEPYRYHRQKHTTLMVKANPEFLENIVWKEFSEYSKHLDELIEEIMGDLIGKIHQHEDETVIKGSIGQ